MVKLIQSLPDTAGPEQVNWLPVAVRFFPFLSAHNPETNISWASDQKPYWKKALSFHEKKKNFCKRFNTALLLFDHC